jgi:hypothetical protein
MSTQAAPSTPSAASSSQPSLDSCSGVCKIDDNFYTDLDTIFRKDVGAKVATDVIAPDCAVKTHNILLPSQENVSLMCDELATCASIRRIELVFPKEPESDWRRRFWGIQIMLAGKPLLKIGNEKLDLMRQIQPDLASEDAENRYMTILDLLDMPLFMNKYCDIAFHAIYKESGAPLGVRVTYSDVGRERADQLLTEHGNISLSTPFLTPLDKYTSWAECKRVVDMDRYEMRIPVQPRTTSVFLYDKFREIQMDGAEAIYCGVKLPINRHNGHIYSITFDPEQALKPLTPRRHYRHVANAANDEQYITLRTKRQVMVELYFTRANLFVTREGLACTRYSSE